MNKSLEERVETLEAQLAQLQQEWMAEQALRTTINTANQQFAAVMQMMLTGMAQTGILGPVPGVNTPPEKMQ